MPTGWSSSQASRRAIAGRRPSKRTNARTAAPEDIRGVRISVALRARATAYERWKVVSPSEKSV
jgi:hypothetical protein